MKMLKPNWTRSYLRACLAEHVPSLKANLICPKMISGPVNLACYKSLQLLNVFKDTSLFASSLVVKCLASYLTSLLLQLYHLDQSVTLETLLPIQLETERLCPPLIGVLRRALKDWSLPNEDLSIPKSWDAWLYFPQCNRDPTVFKDPNLFQADRYQSNLPHGLAFSQGSKICPGIEVIRRMSGQVAMSIGGSYTVCSLVLLMTKLIRCLDVHGPRTSIKSANLFGLAGAKRK